MGRVRDTHISRPCRKMLKIKLGRRVGCRPQGMCVVAGRPHHGRHPVISCSATGRHDQNILDNLNESQVRFAGMGRSP